MGRAMLLLVSGLVVISGIIQMANSNTTKMLPERTANLFYEQQAKNINASLIDNAIRNLIRNNEWKENLSSDQNLQGSGSLVAYTMGDTTIANSKWEWNQWKILLVSNASRGGFKVKTEVLLHRDSFSRFSYFTNAEKFSSGQEIWFGGNDVLTGPVHTNGTFRIRDSPTFNGFVSSPNDWEAYNTHSDPQFNGGTNFSSGTRDLPDNEQIEVLEDKANAIGLTFNGDKELEFYVNEDEGPDGEGYIKTTEEVTTQEQYEYDCNCHYEWVGSGWSRHRELVCQTCTGTHNVTTEQEVEYKLSDYNGIISVDGDVEVKGTIKGEVTLHSSDDIEIMGDIEYYTNPDAEPEDDDYYLGLLGLVSEGDVIVDRDAHEDHGNDDVTIQASIMALGTSFKVEGYDERGSKGTLNILGGIIQNTRGPVGLTNGDGYSKNYVYDQRLRSSVPPEFPRESKFSIVYWKDNVVEKVN